MSNPTSPLRNDRLLHKRTFGASSLLRKSNQLAVWPYRGFLLRTKLSVCEGYFFSLAERLAVLEAHRAYNAVPAYREFIDARVGNISKAKRFSDLPETSKKAYIKPYVDTDKLALYINRSIPAGSSWDTSTGTSGKPTSWYRGPAEVAAAHRIMSHRGRAILGSGSYAFINGFALGPWATGITAARGIGNDSKSVTYNVGAQPHQMLQLIEESKQLAPDRPLVIAGYPPHMEELVRLARESKVPLHEHRILAVVGGEAMSELQRERMRIRGDGKSVEDTGFTQVFSFYGASDLDINLGFETRFEVELRSALAANPTLARAILGDSYPFIPMIFNFDPLSHWIEVNEKNQLVFTDVSGRRISPRVRYNLGDAGTIRPMSAILSALKEAGVVLQHKPRSNLPLVFVWGRIDDGITYRGANLAWENLEESLKHLDLGDCVKGFGLAQYERAGRVETDILLHIPNPTTLPEQNRYGEALLRDLLLILRKLNPDFDHQVRCVEDPQDLPRLRLYRSDSPMAEHSRLNPARKQQHIFLGKDAERTLEIEQGGTLFEAQFI